MVYEDFPQLFAPHDAKEMVLRLLIHFREGNWGPEWVGTHLCPPVCWRCSQGWEVGHGVS